jgi:putative flippase GtrA
MEKIKELYTKYKEVINYLIFGVLTTIVSLATKYLLLFTILDAENGIQLQIAVVVSWIVACTFAYITNRIWVFESKSKEVIKEAIKFYVSRLATLGLEMLIMFIFVTALGLNTHMWVIVWTIFAQVVIVIGNYVLSKLIVFRKK